VPRTLRPRLAPITVAVALVLAALIAVACGSSSPSTPVSSTAVPTAAASASPSPTTVVAATASPPAPATPATPEPVASTAATPTDQLPVVQFVRADGTTVELPVEVPPRREYGIGLSGRTALAGRGMVFYYPNAEGNAGFWMKNTHIDLSIAFVDTGGRITEIDEMQADSLDIHRPAKPYEFAIEAPSGWYAQQRVQAGDQMRLEFALPADILN
jgi:hypothetical protein